MTRDVESAGSWLDHLRGLLLGGDATRPGCEWSEVWRAVIDHPGVRAEVGRRSRLALALAPHPSITWEDVAHDAMLILARQLSRAINLQANRSMADRFEGWIGTILDRACQESIRRARQRDRRCTELVEEPAARGVAISPDLRFDLTAALATLPEAERLVAVLYLGGHSLRRVAEMLEISEPKAGRLWAAARTALQRALSAYRGTGE